MKKIAGTFVALLAILILASAVGFIYIDRLAEVGIEKGGTKALGVPVTLGEADVRVLGGKFAMQGLSIANPRGYENPNFLNLFQGSVSVDLGSLREEIIELPRLELTGIDVNLERRSGSSNYSVIIQNLRRLETGDRRNAKRFIVREIDIRDIYVHVDLLPQAGEMARADLAIDRITLTNIGSGRGRGVKLAELTAVLMQAILEAVAQSGEGLVPVEVLSDLRRNLSQLESLREVGIGLSDEVGEALEDLGAKGTDALKGLGEAAQKKKGGT